MKIMTYVIIGLFSFCYSDAKTILISDIDDTIKNSHVLNKTESLRNAFNIENLVLGMNLIYQSLASNDSNFKFFYVTNAPKSIMDFSHREFLSLNKFPQGSLRLREDFFQSDFKITEIRKIIKVEQPDTLIFIGDNGEKDTFVYQQMKNEFPQIRFLTYIHLAYSRLNPEGRGAVLFPQQVAFVTSMDLALHLRKEGLVSNGDAASFVNVFTRAFAQESDMAEDGEVAIPVWSDCRDFTWTAFDADFLWSPYYLSAKNRILERCQINPN